MKSLTSWFVLIVSIAVLVSSCAKSDESKTASTDNTTSSSDDSSDDSSDNSTSTSDNSSSSSSDPAAITGETMTIGSIDYTSSLLSSCTSLGITSTAGDTVYFKEQIFLYDNKTYIQNAYTFSNSSCTTSLSSFSFMGNTITSPIADSFDNASFVSVSASQSHTGTVTDNSSNVLDNSTYVLLIFNTTSSVCSGNLIGVRSVYPKSTTELEMFATNNCRDSRTFDISQNETMDMVYTPQ